MNGYNNEKQNWKWNWTTKKTIVKVDTYPIFNSETTPEPKYHSLIVSTHIFSIIPWSSTKRVQFLNCHHYEKEPSNPYVAINNFPPLENLECILYSLRSNFQIVVLNCRYFFSLDFLIQYTAECWIHGMVDWWLKIKYYYRTDETDCE